MQKNKNYFLYFIIAFLFYMVCNSVFNAPVSTVENAKSLQTAKLYNYENLKDPEQTSYFSLKDEKLTREKNNYKIKIYPQANYRIYAVVMSKTRYRWGWDAEVRPYDLALAWNALMLPENQKGISYTQSNRWYYYNFDKTFPLTQAYVNAHSSNHHIIPANKNVLNAIDKIRTKEKIYMEGYLVNIRGKAYGKEVWCYSSLTRLDTGDGACEVFYVKRVILNGKVYE